MASLVLGSAYPEAGAEKVPQNSMLRIIIPSSYGVETKKEVLLLPVLRATKTLLQSKCVYCGGNSVWMSKQRQSVGGLSGWVAG